MLPRFEQRHQPRFNTFWTLLGPKQGMPMYGAFHTEDFFNVPGVNELLMDMCDKLPLTKRLNHAYTRGGFINKAKVRDFFHLPKDL